MFDPNAPASARLELTLSRAEFERQIDAAFAPMVRESGNGYSGQADGCAWRLTLAPLPPLRLGVIALERWQADVRLVGSAEARSQWWQRFREHFVKGGG